MAYSLIASVSAGAGVGGDNVTTGDIDTTGANFLVAVIASYKISPDVAISDSKSNTWTARTAYDSTAGSNVRVRIYYAENPGSVGASHNFTASSTDDFPTICVAAFSGAATSTVFDQENGAASNATTTQAPGSVTPSEDNELLVSGLCFAASDTALAIDGGFTIAQQVNFASGTHFGGALAYLIQTTAAAANPTWTHDSSNSMAASIATFKAGAGGGGGGKVHRLMLLGVG